MKRIAATTVCMVVALASVVGHGQNQPPPPVLVDTPGVKVLTGLTVPEFEAEMNTMAAALGVSCGSCHARGNFASEANPRKAVARRMLEMTKGLNQQYFPDYKPAEGESRIGRVTCYTCHQGSERPKTAPPQ
jgi:hypothetical protein